MNTDEIINKDRDHEHWADPGALSDGMSCPGNGNDNDASDSEEDTQGGGTGPGNVKGTKAGKGNGKASEDEKWKGKGKQKQMEKGKGQGRGYGQGKGSVGQSPGGDNISRAVALQLQTAMYKADSDTVGYVEWFCWEPEVSPAVTISSGDDTDSTEESDGEYDSEHDSHVNMLVEDEVDAPYGTDLDCNVDMERDCNDVEKEDEQEEDEHEEDEEKEDEQEEEMEEEEEEEEENEEEDEDEDDGKDPQTIGQREMVNALANDVGTMVEDQPMVLPDQGQEMCEHTQWPQLLGPAPYPQTAEPRRWPQTTETHTLGGRECSRLVTPQKPHPVRPTQRGAEAARNTSVVDMDQQLLSESTGGSSLPDVPLPNVALPEVPLPQVRPDGSVGQEWTSPRLTEEAMVVGSGLGSGSCLVCFPCSTLFISVID